MGGETGRNKNQLRFKCPHSGHPDIADQKAHIIALGGGRHRYVYHVFRRGILVLVRKQRMLKKTAHQHTRIAGKRFFSSIAMMNIEIDNRHALEAVLFKGIGSSNGNIVKKTKDRKSVM